jgi:hypothetical protein
MTGRNLGQQTSQAPLARQSGGGGVTLNVNAGPPPEKPETPQAQPMQAMQPPGPILSPDTYMKVLDAYMNALLESTKTGKPLIGGIY